MEPYYTPSMHPIVVPCNLKNCPDLVDSGLPDASFENPPDSARSTHPCRQIASEPPITCPENNRAPEIIQGV